MFARENGCNNDDGYDDDDGGRRRASKLAKVCQGETEAEGGGDGVGA